MSEDKTKKTRRQWLLSDDSTVLKTAEGSFDTDELTAEGQQFIMLYGCKQYLADSVASKGGVEYTDAERLDTMQDRFDNLCSDKFVIVKTEAGFYFRDPDATPVSRGGGVGRSKVVQGLMDKHGWSEDKAILFWNEISGKVSK